MNHDPVFSEEGRLIDFARSTKFFSICIEDFPDRPDSFEANQVLGEVMGSEMVHADKPFATPFSHIGNDRVLPVRKIDPLKPSALKVPLK